MRKLFFAACCFVAVLEGFTVPQSPCPHLFYYTNEGGQVKGTLRINPPEDYAEIIVNARFQLNKRLQNIYYGHLELLEDKDSIKNRLRTGNFAPIFFSVNFPSQNPLPVLTSLTVNGKEICSNRAGRTAGPYSLLDLKYELNYPGFKISPNWVQDVTGIGIRPFNPLINAFKKVFNIRPQQSDAQFINPGTTNRPYHNPYYTSNSQPYTTPFYNPLPNSQSNQYNNPNNNQQPIYSNHPEPTAQPTSYNNPYTTPYYNPFPTTQTTHYNNQYNYQQPFYSNDPKPTAQPSSYHNPYPVSYTTPYYIPFPTAQTTQYNNQYSNQQSIYNNKPTVQPSSYYNPYPTSYTNTNYNNPYNNHHPTSYTSYNNLHTSPHHNPSTTPRPATYYNPYPTSYAIHHNDPFTNQQSTFYTNPHPVSYTTRYTTPFTTIRYTVATTKRYSTKMTTQPITEALSNLEATPNPISFPASISSGSVCGEPFRSTSSQENKRREWPWLVAIFLLDCEFICAGTLVSNKHVITAASCFGDVGKIGPINKENYLVYLGKYDINKEVEDYSYIKEVESIIPHASMVAPGSVNIIDVAVITFQNTVQFDHYVMPICLYEPSPSILHEKRVIGWGAAKTSIVADSLKPKKIELFALSDKNNCSNIGLSKFSFSDVICARFNSEKIGVCKEDKGAGMFEKDTYNERWFLRGVLSRSSWDNAENSCNPKEPAIFMNMDSGAVKDWIIKEIQNTNL